MQVRKAAQPGRQVRRPRLQGAGLLREHLQDRDPLNRVGWRTVESQGRCKGRRRQLVQPQGPGQGVGLEPVHQGPAACGDPGLGSAQQLVPAEQHQVHAGLQAGLHCGLVRDAERGEVDQGPAAQVLDQEEAMGVGEVGQALQGRGAGEARDPEVAGMGAQEDPGVGVLGQGLLVVAQVGAVGGPDLDQPRAALGHHVRHPEAAADLHELAPGHDDRGALGQGREGQEHGAGAVVHHEAGLGPGHLGDQRVEVRLA